MAIDRLMHIGDIKVGKERQQNLSSASATESICVPRRSKSQRVRNKWKRRRCCFSYIYQYFGTFDQINICFVHFAHFAVALLGY